MAYCFNNYFNLHRLRITDTEHHYVESKKDVINPTELWDADNHSSAIHDPRTKYIRPKGGCQTRKAGKAYFKPTDRGRYSPSWGRAGIGNATEDQQRRSAPASGDWLPDFHSQR